MLVLYDKATLLHKTVEILGAKLKPALECPERITAILEALKASPEHDVREIEAPDALVAEILMKTHDAQYLTHLQEVHSLWVKNGHIEDDGVILPECFRLPPSASTSRHAFPPKDHFARAGYYAFDMSSGISKDSWTSILSSANLALCSATAVTSSTKDNSDGWERQRNVLALCRPPGHHCNGEMAGGYCYVNNTAVAVEALRQLWKADGTGFSVPKIAILDIDFHHGNGTQEIFYSDPKVLYVSIHGEDEYPYYSGFAEEKGNDRGFGFNVNVPLATDSSVQQYMAALDTGMEAIVEFRPDFLLVSLGFDTFRLDPLGKFDIDTADYEDIARKIRGAAQLSEVPAIILLEGGYVIEMLGANVVAFLTGWEEGDWCAREMVG